MPQALDAPLEIAMDRRVTSAASTDTVHDIALGDIDLVASATDFTDMLALCEDRLDSMGLIVRGISHDINNLLTVIGGFGAILKHAVDGNTGVQVAVNGLDDATSQLASLTRILSSLASRRAMKMEGICINGLLASMDRTIRHLMGNNVVVHIRRHAGNGKVQAVRGQLERVLLNLVMNAREAIGGKGRLLVEATTLHLAGNDACRRGLPAGEYINLSVTDTGCGMSSATIQRVFEPAFSTKATGRGHGLATVKRIVAECGGAVFAHSEVGRGATFEILLPCFVE